MNELEALTKRVAVLEAGMARVLAGLGAAAGVASSSQGGRVAPVKDLDGKDGDPKVKKDPPRWSGKRYAGKHFSQTSPEYLDELAEFFDWRADREEEEPERRKYARYSRADAALARGWGVRLRNGWQPTKPASAFDQPKGATYGSSDDFPFDDDEESPPF